MPSATRDKLVEAARRLFWKQGYHPTGIAQVLEGAGALSGSLYHFFPTKEDLLHAVLDRYLEMLRPAVLDPVFARVTDPLERVFGILDGYRRQLKETKFVHGCPIGSLAIELAHTHPGARKRLADNFDAWRAAVEGCLEEAAGRLQPGTDTAALAHAVLVTMEGAVMMSRVYRSFEPFDAAVRTLRDHIESLVRKGTDWKKPRRSKPRKR